MSTAVISFENMSFTELTSQEKLLIIGGGFWGGVVTGLITVGTVVGAIAFAPEAAAGAAVVTGYYIATGLAGASGTVSTVLAFLN